MFKLLALLLIVGALCETFEEMKERAERPVKQAVLDNVANLVNRAMHERHSGYLDQIRQAFSRRNNTFFIVQRCTCGDDRYGHKDEIASYEQRDIPFWWLFMTLFNVTNVEIKQKYDEEEFVLDDIEKIEMQRSKFIWEITLGKAGTTVPCDVFSKFNYNRDTKAQDLDYLVVACSRCGDHTANYGCNA